MDELVIFLAVVGGWVIASVVLGVVFGVLSGGRFDLIDFL